MEKTAQDDFFANDWRVSPAQCLLTRGTETVHIEPKAMEVLVYLASHPNEVVSREELEREVWRGALVGYDAVTNTIIKLRKALQDNARQPTFIATIPKRGYQLIATLSRIEEDDSPQFTSNAVHSAQTEVASKPRTKMPFAYARFLPAMLVVILLAASIAWQVGSRTDPSQAEQLLVDKVALPSILVLPFETFSEDPKQQFLANGMTEDIITDLSRLSNILVYSSNTSSRFKDRDVSPEKLGSELGAKYVLKGHIRRSGEQIRMNTQLINTRTGFNVWAQRYDRKLSELFSVQDEVTNRIVESLVVKLTHQEKDRIARRATDSLKAYDFFQEGQRLVKMSSKQTNQQARDFYRKAIETDENYGRAYGALAVTLALDYRRGWTDAPYETLERALVMARKGVELDNSTPQIYWALGFVHLARKEYQQAEQAALTSIRIAPNYADGYGLLGLMNMYLARPQKAIEYNQKGMQLNPYYTFHYLYVMGAAYYMLGQYEQAIKVLEEAQVRDENAVQVKLMLAACYVKANREQDAKWLAEQLAVISPSSRIMELEKTIPILDPVVKQGFLDDLRIAGLPE